MLHAVLCTEASRLHHILLSTDSIVRTKASINEIPERLIDQLIVLIFDHFLTANEVFWLQHIHTRNTNVFIEPLEKRLIFYGARMTNI